MAGDYKKPEKIFFILSAVSEVLSMSNEPQQLLDMTLDTLFEVLKIDCCWVQLLSLESRKLWLAAYRGFTPEMKHEIGSMHLGQSFGNQVAGLGHKIVIPDLSRDSERGLSSFSKAGFRSLVAVPMRTYRVQGVLGIAFRTKKRFLTQVTELLTVIASLIGVALDKANLYQRMLVREKQLSTGIQLSVTSNLGKDGIHQDLVTELKEAVEKWAMATGEAEKAAEQIARLTLPSQANSYERQGDRAAVPKKARVTDKIKVFIVDRDLLFCQGLRLYLSQTRDMEVIGNSEDFAKDTALMIEELASDVVLVDADLPSLSGFDLARQLTRHSPSIAVIMLVPYEDDNHILEALRAGVAGYLSKGITGEGLASAVRRVFKGEHIISELLVRPRTAQRVLLQLQDMEKEGSAKTLSPQEMEMLGYFAYSYSPKQVAHAVAISDETIKESLASIASKLVADGRTQ